MPDNLEEQIRENAAGPQSVVGDQATVRQHSLRDQIEADRYLESKKAAKKALGIRLVKMIPPGVE